MCVCVCIQRCFYDLCVGIYDLNYYQSDYMYAYMLSCFSHV